MTRPQLFVFVEPLLAVRGQSAVLGTPPSVAGFVHPRLQYTGSNVVRFAVAVSWKPSYVCGTSGRVRLECQAGARCTLKSRLQKNGHPYGCPDYLRMRIYVQHTRDDDAPAEKFSPRHYILSLIHI